MGIALQWNSYSLDCAKSLRILLIITVTFALGGLDLYGQNYGLLKKIFDPDGAMGDNYGWSVSVSDSVAVVGAPMDSAGSAHVYFRNAGGMDNWGFVKRISIMGGEVGDQFGYSVAVSDTIIVVGAPFEDVPGSNSGAAYVFSKNTGGPDNWGLVTALAPTNVGSQDEFGTSVTISGTYIAVGAPENTTGTVHIFQKDEGGLNNWGEVTMIAGTASGDLFGFSLDLRDTILAVGAPGDDVGGNSDQGSAYIYYRDNDNWTLQQTIISSDGTVEDRFGTSVALDSVTLVVGAPFDDDDGLDSGSAYLFQKDEGGTDNWGELPVKLVGSSTAAGDQFGFSVSMSQDVILIGAPQDDDSGASSGTSFIFRQNQGGPNNWGETQRLLAFDAVSGDQFGYAVDIEGPFLYVGAPTDDDSGLQSGSVYIYREDEVICPEAPTLECQDITIYLDESGVAEITPDDLNAGSFASCEFNVTLSQSIFSCDDIGDNPVTLTLIDLIGNQAECIAIVTVLDTIGPEFVNCPVDTLTVTNNAGECVGNVIWSIPVAQDNCLIDSIVQISGPQPGTSIPLGTYEIQYVAYDPQLLTDTCTFVLVIVDTEAPFLACPPDLQFNADADECDWTSSVGQLDPLIAIDNCEPVLEYVITTSTGMITSDSGAVGVFDFPVGVNTVCYMLTDSSGSHSDTCCFTVTVYDTQIPQIDCPEHIEVNTDPGVCEAEVSWTIPTPTDNCQVAEMTQTIIYADGSTSFGLVNPDDYGSMTMGVFPKGINSIIYVVTDTSGNMNACFFEISVFDNEAPQLECPSDITINTSDGSTGDCAGNLTFTHPIPTDNCEIASFTLQILNPNGAVEGPYEVTPGAMQNRDFDLGTSTISYIAVDSSNNSVSCNYIVVVLDDEDPEFITCPPDTLTIGTDVDVCGAFVNWATPIAEDNCGVEFVEQIAGPMQGDSLAPGFYTIVYVAYDGASPPNTDTCTFVLNIVDTQAPLILCPPSYVVVNSDDGTCTWTPPLGSLTPTIAIGNCPYEVTWAVFKDDTLQATGFEDVSGNHTFNLDTSFVCYYITETEDLDSNGIMTDTCCFMVIVQDNEDPVITCPDDVTFLDSDDDAEDCQHTVGDTGLDASATDNCAVVSLTHDYAGFDSTTLNGAVFPVGITIVTWTAVDTAGNVETCSFVVTVLDNIDPFIECPADVSIGTSDGGTGDCLGEYNWTHPTPTDNCAVTQYNYSVTNADGTQSGPLDLVPLLNPNAPGVLFDASFDFQLGVSTVVYFAADAAGNAFDCSFTVTVTDDENPQFVNCPPDTITIGTDVDNCSAFVNWAIPIAEDNCEVIVTQIGGPMPGDELAPGFYTIIYLAEDGATPPNTDTCEFVINVVDTQEPLILCPSNEIVVSADDGMCTWFPPAGSLTPTIAIANCPYEVTWAVFKDDTLQATGFDDVSENHTFNLDTSIVCYYITETEDLDSNGILTDTCCFMVIVQDNEAPVITCPANVTFLDSEDGEEDCQHTVDDMALDATATDNCAIVSLTHDYASVSNTTLEGAVFPVGITIITWTAVDTAGNVETCFFVVTVEDDIAPEVTCPDDVEITTSNNGTIGDCLGEYDWIHPTPTDNCAVTQYNYRIINADGTISGPFDLVPLLNPNAPPELFEASYDFQLDTSIVEYYVEDEAGNLDTCTFSVVVTDDEAPMFLNCPPDTVSYGTEVDLCGAFANYPIPIAEDNCEVAVMQIAGPVSGEFLVPGFYTVIWVALDPSGNSDTCEFVIRVIDTQIPDIECPTNDVVIDADTGVCTWTSPAGSLSPISAFDNCAFTVTWEKTNPDGSVETGMDDVSGEVFALDTTIVCYIITENEDPDLNGIQADTCCFIVVVQDTELPMISCPDDVTFFDTQDEEEDCAHTVSGTDLDATATDNCAVVSLTHDYPGGSNTTLDTASFPVGTTTVTWTATDTAGNITTCSFTVTVIDNIPPSITCPEDTIIQTSVGGQLDCFGEFEWSHPLPTDNCNIIEYTVAYTNPDSTTEGPFDLLNPPVSFGDRLFAVGVSIVTYYVEDSSGNSSGCSFTVTVEDSEDPIFVNCPDTLFFSNDPSLCGAFVNWPEPIAVDNCNDTLNVVQVGGPPSGSFIPAGVPTVITYQATDDEGNTVQCVFTVVVEDNEIPNAVCQDTVVYLDENGMVTITPDYVDGGSSDNCGIDSATVSITEFTCDDIGENNVLLTVYDANGNADICIAEVSVFDTIPPEFECPLDSMISVCEQFVPDFITGLTGTDNCTDVTFMQNPLPNVQFFVMPGDTFEVVITATDDNGNTSTCVVNLIVFDEDCTIECIGDQEPPEWINCPRPPINEKAISGLCKAFVNFSLPVALDNCEVDTIIQIDSTGLTTGDMFPVGLTILKWIAIDVEGNISDTCRIKIFVDDLKPPQLLCPEDTSIINKPGTCGGTVFGISPIALDNCLVAVTFKVEPLGGSEILNAGADDASGEEFENGVSEVTYKVSDQPVILISEVTHELEALNGGTNPVPGFIQTTTGDDFIEVTNYGPTTMNMSCLTIERIGGNNEVFVVPDDVILEVGEVLTLHYGDGTDSPANHFYNVSGAADLSQSDGAGYVISIDTVAIDVVAVNGFDPVGGATMSNIHPVDWSGTIDISEGGSAYRKWAWDSNSEQDYALADLCMPATIGTLNPDTDLLDDIGITYSLQSLPPNTATCSFLVTVEDTQLPECGELVSTTYAGQGGEVGPISIMQFTINVPDNFIVYDVNVLDLIGSHPDMSQVTVKLTPPFGSGVLLFGELCPGQADFDLSLDSDSLTSVNVAPCAPLGGGDTFAPQGDLEDISGQVSLGQWMLTILNADPVNTLTLESWVLELSEAFPYSQADTTLENDPGECGAEFTWMHPFNLDNCGEGDIVVTYTSEDSIPLPTGGTVVAGSEATEFFWVGTTTVTYTLTDESGNTNTCSFDVTVLDVEIPVLVCPDDITINLGPGDCGSIESYIPLIFGDNCEIDTFIIYPPSGTLFEVGVHVVTIIGFDISGNSDTCTFTLTVNPYIPTSNTIACNDTVNISLGADCMYQIGADVILEGDDYGCYDDFCIVALDENGDTIPDAILTLDHVGQYITVIVTDCQGTGLSCWGTLFVEDKLNPVIACPPDITVGCNESTDTSFTGYPELLSCELEVTITYEDEIIDHGDCGEPRVDIYRTWIVTDESGNAGTCIQHIVVQSFDFSMIQFPPDFVGATALLCEDVLENPDLTEPDYAGWPTINGLPVFGNHFCEFNIGYWDEFLWDANCPGSYEILRNWIIRDECLPLEFGLNPLRHIQSINVKDRTAPEINAWVSYDPSLGSSSECTGVVYLGATADDACSEISEIRWRAQYTEGNFTQIVKVGVLPQNTIAVLPLGRTYTFIFAANDACNHIGKDTVVVDMTDAQVPIAVCDEHTIVSLTEDADLEYGLTKVPAMTFDDGSYDNCSEVVITARRLSSCINFDWTTLGAGIDDTPNGVVNSADRGLGFGPYVPFACCDVGAGPIMIEMRVTDAEGNSSTCMVEIEVQDKLAPLMVCVPDITVSCEFWFDAQETNGFVDQSEDVLTPVFGRVLDAFNYNASDRNQIVIDDPGNPELPQPYIWGLDGWADDNCEVTIDVRTRIFDDCSGDELPGGAPDYAVRLIERTFRAQDGQGNTSTCRQRIWVVDFDPFYITDEVCGLNNADDVRWPCDLVLTDCPEGELTPENLSDYAPDNAPVVNDDNCSLIGITYEDQIFYFVDNACYKIIRKWIVIDWCQYDPVEETGYWTYIQVIKVHDEDGPEFLNCPDGPVTYCVADSNVQLPSNNQVFLGEGDPNSSACSVHVGESRTIYETCSDVVIYDVKIYPHNGDEFVQILDKTEAPVDSNGQAVLEYHTRDKSSLPSNHSIRKYGLPYNDRFCSNWPLPGGTKDYYRVLWSVEDGCGNLSTCEYLMRLEDCKQPTPICVGLSSVVMPSSGSVTIWAKDFDSGSSVDDCTAHEDLLFSFSGENYEPSRDFDCAAIEANGSPSFLVEIWVADEGNDQDCDGFIQSLGIEWSERNKDYCTTFIVIDDNEGVCGVGAGGVIETEELESVEQVTVNLTNPVTGEVMASYTTIGDGVFFFINPLLGYKMSSKRNDNHKNGVSTLDLVKIQKHLLGIQLLDSPYKMIAADANNSESVSILDLVEVRKLVLGLYTEFPNNESWRFVNSAFAFADPKNPWPFEEVVDVAGLTMGHDFVGVKIGDVNGNVVANADQIVVRDAKGVLELMTEEQSVVEGQTVQVPVSSANFSEILGYQFTMTTKGLILTGIESGALDLTAENIGVHPGEITMSWNDVRPVTTSDVLFTLTFTAVEGGSLNEMLRIVQKTKLTEAEAYNGAEELLDVMLTFRKGAAVYKEFALFQNEPNPFLDGTTIGFTLPETMMTKVTFTDAMGRVLYVIEREFIAGYNEVYITQRDLSNTGIIYYQLQAGDFTATKKMVTVK